MSSEVTHSKINNKVPEHSIVHLAFLDGMRAIAAVYVVIYHILGQIPSETDAITNMLIKPFKLGHYAVDVFIILSGFCLMLPIIRKGPSVAFDVRSFFKKRAIRILPTYFLAMILSIFLIYTLIGKKTGTHWDICIPVTEFDIISHIFLFQDIFYETSAKINHTFWSISVEWRIYLFFPLFVLSFKKIGAFTTTVLLVLVSIIGWFLIRETSLNASIGGINFHYAGLFTLGMLAASISYSTEYVFIKIRSNIALPFIKWFMLGMALLAICINGRIAYWVFSDLLIGICTAYLLVGISSNTFEKTRNFLSVKPFVFVGTFAYSIYLLHAPLLQIISQYVIMPLQLNSLQAFLFLLFAGVPLILTASYLFFLTAEYPFIKKKIIHN